MASPHLATIHLTLQLKALNKEDLHLILKVAVVAGHVIATCELLGLLPTSKVNKEVGRKSKALVTCLVRSCNHNRIVLAKQMQSHNIILYDRIT